MNPRATLVFTTIERSEKAIEVIESARARMPDLPILVAEQAAEDTEFSSYCAKMGVRHLRIPFDSGVSAARNILVKSLETDYFVLSDDDVYFDRPININFCVRFLDEHPDFLCVAGSRRNHIERDGEVVAVHVEQAINLAIDERGGGIIRLPVTTTGTTTVEHEGETVLVCDYVPNWGVFRRSSFFENDLWWDERFIIGGEHLDFFLTVKLHTALKVGYWEELSCVHNKIRSKHYRVLRERHDWKELFANKWPHRYIIDLGRSMRFFSDYDNLVEMPSIERLRAQKKLEALATKITSLKTTNEKLQATKLILKSRIEIASKEVSYQKSRVKKYDESNKALRIRNDKLQGRNKQLYQKTIEQNIIIKNARQEIKR